MIEYPNKLDIIFDKLQKYNIKPVIVGGYVRDYFFNKYEKSSKRLTKDIDIELYNAESFEQLQNILCEFGNPNLNGKNFGVIKLKVDDLDIDFSLPRTDNKVSSGHTGFEVDTYSDISFHKASSRRDFTINAIGFDIFNKKILDPFGGLEDLKQKKLKMVSQETFIEDPLRVLRAMQFCARFELKPDYELIDAASKMCENNLLDELPRERIYEEFKKLFLKAKHISIGLNFLKDVNGFIYFSELNMSESDWHIKLKYIDSVDKTKLDNATNIAVVLALLCYKMEENAKQSFLNKIINKKTTLKTIDYLHHIDSYLESIDKKDFDNTLKYKILKDIDTNTLKIYLEAKSISEDIIRKIYSIKPIVHGKDLMKSGFKPSKEFDSLLQMIYEVQLLKLFN
ncbi:CCA tRNA nucleotidyltransferase [Sulfurimonas sp.]|uniref:CCA tRNA nucleotidyltransferase n=1 Tax=Sulfurimonas sp. TaxID=2022749 RepID=UPI00356AB629